jgi:glycerate-2-kinase
MELDGRESTRVCAVATDGQDGSSGTSGGFVSGDSCRLMRGAGIDSEKWLIEGRAFEALQAVAGCIPGKVTNINHCDLFLGLSGSAVKSEHGGC